MLTHLNELLSTLELVWSVLVFFSPPVCASHELNKPRINNRLVLGQFRNVIFPVHLWRLVCLYGDVFSVVLTAVCFSHSVKWTLKGWRRNADLMLRTDVVRQTSSSVLPVLFATVVWNSFPLTCSQRGRPLRLFPSHTWQTWTVHVFVMWYVFSGEWL